MWSFTPTTAILPYSIELLHTSEFTLTISTRHVLISDILITERQVVFQNQSFKYTELLSHQFGVSHFN
jgi:hypothetical protein